MNKEQYEIIDNAHKIGKYSRLLQKCREYIFKIKLGCVSIDTINEANRFSEETYNEIKHDDARIVLANTISAPRNVDPVINLVMNLEALEIMLSALLGEGLDKLNKDLREEDTFE